jgi:ubiquinone/menaquinone biosynthesis C-methylase UbiE
MAESVGTSARGADLKAGGGAFWNANPCGGDWASYAAFMEWMQRTEPYAYEILGGADWKGHTVLDVGCGQGTLLNFLPTLGAKVVGIDRSRVSLHRSLEGAREMGHRDRVRVALADVEVLPFPDESFDRVVSFGVLHHTPGTDVAIDDIWRVLKPGGVTYVMLYRRGNPKWWATVVARAAARMLDALARRRGVVADALRPHHDENDARGTALLELFGVPVLKAYSNRQAQALFRRFSNVTISNHQAGFRRMVDIFPIARPLESGLAWIDRATRETWGFYQVIRAEKPRA